MVDQCPMRTQISEILELGYFHIKIYNVDYFSWIEIYIVKNNKLVKSKFLMLLISFKSILQKN